ncbi:MAG: helix-turn-helix transcriptional regulator [Burkholderiaceae bacterium]
MFKLEEFSDTLLELNVLARQSGTRAYQHQALARVQRILPFDFAWWGIMSAHEDSFRLHSSHLFELPSGYIDVWERTKRDDNVARAVCKRPSRTLYFDDHELRSAPGLAVLTGAHGIHQAFCTSAYLPSESAFIFLSLYRARPSPRFTSDELLLNQYLMPHLCSSWSANREHQIDRLRIEASSSLDAAVALVDRGHELLNVEPDFLPLLRLEWPDDDGVTLPAPVIAWLRAGEASLKLRRIVLHRHAFDEFLLIEARRRTRADSLSPREAAIAEASGAGLSYKEIARRFDCAPATIRHHLRVIYEKLDVGDKATMIGALNRQTSPLRREDLGNRQHRLRHGA